MKKYLFIILIILAVIIIIPNENEEFRIRVIANSDSQEDQEIKMKVVKAITIELKQYNDEDLINEIKRNLNKIDKLVSNILNHNEYTIDIKKTQFPPKELNGEVISGGKYLALVIVIEEGLGKNWWTLLSPNFNKCFEDNETANVDIKFFFFEELKKGFNN